MKRRLIVGTINHWPDDGEWENTHVDISAREIWDVEKGPVPVDIVADLADGLPMIRPGRFDEVRCHHVLEHMTLPAVKCGIDAVWRVLKRGGVFDVEVPDMDRIAQAWVNEEYPKEDLQQWIYGEQLPRHEPGDNHRYGFWADKLRVLLEIVGFEVPAREETGLAVRYIARKP